MRQAVAGQAAALEFTTEIVVQDTSIGGHSQSPQHC